jgi:hypothetical protein
MYNPNTMEAKVEITITPLDLSKSCRDCVYFKNVGGFDSREVWCEAGKFAYEDLPGGLVGILPSEVNLKQMADNCPDFTRKEIIPR